MQSKDEELRLSEVAREKGVCIATVHRWRLKGVKGIRLEPVKAVGGRLTVTREALERFDQQLTDLANGVTSEKNPQANSAHQRAKQRLEGSGFFNSKREKARTPR